MADVGLRNSEARFEPYARHYHIASSTNMAGKVMMGPNNSSGLCVLVFTTSVLRSCVAVE
ncbi:MAG: hypothetical protein JO189_02080 [Deltaproteobacteria bacterium]|nr:hypothetical protein [Deltaproteobacteria bacterium]